MIGLKVYPNASCAPFWPKKWRQKRQLPLIGQKTWPTVALNGLAIPTADDSFAAMKALITFIAIAAVSVAGAGFYYVSSTSESECPASTGECGMKKPCDEAAKPDCGANPDCTDQKKACHLTDEG